jgi:hypothetical protein
MNLKNYTSSVPMDMTVSRIERLLVDVGASGIAKEYRAGTVCALMFRLQFAAGQPEVTIKLPANVEACVDSFWKDYCRTRSTRSQKRREDFQEQAARTAWKLQQDWVEVQVSMIRLKQQDAMQAFLPYAWDGAQTVYERVRDGGFRALLPAPKPDDLPVYEVNG